MRRLNVRVKPQSSLAKVLLDGKGGAVVWIREKPVEGRANEALVRALAEHFGVAKSRVTLKGGLHSKNKVVEIDD